MSRHGHGPQETQQLMELIQFIREKFALTILLIEHNVTGYGCVSAFMAGLHKLLQRIFQSSHTNPKVIEAYLGGINDVKIENLHVYYDAIVCIKGNAKCAGR